MDINYYINLINKDHAHDSRGGNSICYVFDDVILLYGSIDITNIDRKIKTINEMKASGVNVVPTLEYKINETQSINTYGGIEYQMGWTLQEKAPGIELYPKYSRVIVKSEDEIQAGYLEYKKIIINYYNSIKRLSEATQEQIEKFVNDYAALEQSSLKTDPSKTGNFFYDIEKGFSFIDIGEKDIHNHQMKSLMDHILVVMIPFLSNLTVCDKDNMYKNDKKLVIVPKEISDQLKSALDQLLARIILAFKKYGFSTQEINTVIEKRLSSIIEITDNVGYSDEEALQYIKNTLENIKEMNSTISETNSDEDEVGMVW